MKEDAGGRVMSLTKINPKQLMVNNIACPACIAVTNAERGTKANR